MLIFYLLFFCFSFKELLVTDDIINRQKQILNLQVFDKDLKSHKKDQKIHKDISEWETDDEDNKENKEPEETKQEEESKEAEVVV